MTISGFTIYVTPSPRGPLLLEWICHPFRNPRTHKHSDDNAVRASGGGTETLCSREARKLQACRNRGGDGKKSAGLYNFRYSAVRKTMMNAHNSLKDLVGAPRFELGTSCAQGRRATRLRYAPTVDIVLILL